VFGANRNVYFGRAESGTLESDFAGNLVEVCPTGVFVDKPFSARFRRKWDMRATPSICPHCAVGCNITVQEREGEFRRVTNRYNETLNGYFLCDRGRFGTGFIESTTRLHGAQHRAADGTTTAIDTAAATEALAALLSRDSVIGIGSPRASLEANIALRTIVGSENFFAGLSDHDASILTTAINLMRDDALPIATLADVEHADAIIIFGDDPATIAPRLALALRQSAQRATAATLADRQIPAWNDTPARIAAAEHHNPLVIATPMPSQLDNCASHIHRLAPAAILDLAVALAPHLDNTLPTTIIDEPIDLTRIISILTNAISPVIVVGGEACGADLLRAAANIVIALRSTGTAARLSILLPEVNSVGLGLLDAPPLAAALAQLASGAARDVIVLEHDLHRRAETTALEHAFANVESMAVLDTIETPTTNAASLAIAVGSFADIDCTFVNLEGRAQRGFKAIFSTEAVPSAWHILRDAGILAGRLPPGTWPDHAAMVEAIAATTPSLAPCRSVWPDAPTASMQRPATLPHRYSGRTAVNAATDVREPAPFANPDSPLGTTMEGPVLHPDAALVPYIWSPGWNSAQAVNKFQSSIGGAMRSDNAGVMLFNGNATRTDCIALPKPTTQTTRFIPITRVFGSEELSALAPPIAARTTSPTVHLNTAEAAARNLSHGDTVDCIIGTTHLTRIVTIEPDMPDGVIGVTIGFPNDAAAPLPGHGTIVSTFGAPA
jgi:NADH-quinone oxidoreductase subunit G